MPLEIIEVKRVKDACGAYCLVCMVDFNPAENPFWHWRKSQAMHEKGTGHKMVMYTFRKHDALDFKDQSAVAQEKIRKI